MTNINSKQKMRQLQKSGAFGNTTKTWDTPEEMLDDILNIRCHVVLRSKKGGGGGEFFPSMRPLKAFLEWNTAGVNSYYAQEATNNQKVILQGEIWESPTGLELAYSRFCCDMRTAAKIGFKRITGLQARAFLHDTLSAASWDDVQELLTLYPNHVIEFSTFNRLLGNCRGRNTIIWEVRNY